MKRLIPIIVVTLAGGVAIVLWRPTRRLTPAATSRSQAAVAVPPTQPEPPALAPLPASEPNSKSSTPASPPDETTQLQRKIQQALASPDQAIRDVAINQWLPDLMRRSPRAGAYLAETAPEGELRDLLVQQVSRIWATLDLNSALEWAAGSPYSEEREFALDNVCAQVAEANPPQAIALREKYIPEGGSYQPIETLVQKWAYTNLLATVAWLDSRPPGEKRDSLIASIAPAYAEKMPLDAARFVTGKMSPGPAQTEAAISVLYQWAKQDPSAARAWAEAFPAGPLRERALHELATLDPFSRRE